MGDYASKGLANGVGIPALVLGSLGFLQSGGLGSGLFGNTNATAMSAVLAEKDSEIAKLSAEKYTDNKISETYFTITNQINKVAADLASLSIANEKRISAVEGQISCMAQATNTALVQLNNTVSLITKTVIPTSAICPEVMPRYNSWTASNTATA